MAISQYLMRLFPTFSAAVEFRSHGNVPMPCLRVYTNVTSDYWIFKDLHHGCISITICLKYLQGKMTTFLLKVQGLKSDCWYRKVNVMTGALIFLYAFCEL